MDFVKVFQPKLVGTGHKCFGYALLEECTLKIFIHSKEHFIKQVGLVEGGIGVVLEKAKNETKKTGIIQARRFLGEDDIPVNLQASGYKFRINADKISDTEYVFKFDNAVTIF